MVVSFIADNFFEKLNIDKLHYIEIVDRLENNSSGKSIKDKIILPRKYGLEGIRNFADVSMEREKNIKLKMLIGTIYHELWHVSTWDKYKTMYEYVLNKKVPDIYTAYGYMYWIEYIAHTETIFMEAPELMREFCNKFVEKSWHKMEDKYSYFIKALPYYLIRSQYLNVFDEFTKNIIPNELRQAVYDFDRRSKELLHNRFMDDIEKADKIKSMIEQLFA